jgi:hypothetical protein
LSAVFACVALHPACKPTRTRPAPRAEPTCLLLEPVAGKTVDGLPLVKELSATDPRRREIEQVLKRPFQRWVLDLGVEVRRRALARCTLERAECDRRFRHPAYFVVKKGGNRPMRGLAIQRGAPEKLPNTWYIEMSHRGVESLVPHEYGHILMYTLLPESLHDHAFGHRRTLPHTTGAITNDLTAFTEGWAIHFETLVGDRRENPEHHARLHRDSFGIEGEGLERDSFFATRDLLSYAQSYRRHACIKENCFAYLPRTPEALISSEAPTPTQLRASWSDTTVDPARLRTLEQMVASEGVVAALFYRLGTAPDPAGPRGEPGDPPLPDPRRYGAFFDAFSELTPDRVTRTPFVLAFLERLIAGAGGRERQRIVRIAAEVFHHTLAVRDAPKIHGQIAAAARVLDKKQVQGILSTVAPRIDAGLKEIAARPELLRKAAAPELWLVNDEVKLDVPIFGIKALPVALDVNTATVPFLMTLPGVDYARARRVESSRQERGGYQNLDAFLASVDLPAGTRARIAAMHQAPPGGP